MGMKIYGIPKSCATACVMTCLGEKVIEEYELVHVDLSKGEHKSSSHLAKNPFGKVPVLEDGSLTLFESRAITGYLCRKYKSGTDLLRCDSVEEGAMVGVWLEVESQQFSAAIYPIMFEKLMKPFLGLTPDQSVVDEYLLKLGSVLDIYEERLSNSKYLACDSFTLADLHHLPYIHYFIKRTPYGDLITSRAHVKAWWEDISARPSFVKVAQQMDARPILN
ncbi:glutathione S-transferase F13-like [Papaver somniferum]|uniref:glutathione S-transferase F13-like n=1 Tax=Papaver somniferum TaxID=3469 RepID=UPI000E6FF8AA|nr:glutathione S-transferase F13-like [Papaver somniferum]